MDDPWTTPSPIEAKKAESAMTDFVAEWVKTLPPGAKLHFECENHTYEGEEAFSLLFGWLPEEDQRFWRELLASGQDEDGK